VVGLRAGSPTRPTDPHPRLEGGGGDALPFPASLLQSYLEGRGIARIPTLGGGRGQAPAHSTLGSAPV
jgi:hypothetical protein